MKDYGSEKGAIFKMQRYSLHDGPGIRTLIFVKGCPLRCRWCSNPEGLSPNVEIKSVTKKCIRCGACETACPKGAISGENYEIDRAQCDICGECVRVCPTGSKDFFGEEKTVDQVVAIIARDMPFYGDGEGGVTVGGGEMLSRPDFSYGILKRCKELGISTAIETSGHGKKEDLLKIAEVSDTIHFDIKALDPELHKKITGVDNGLILDNLKALDKKLMTMNPKPTLVLRLPLIEGFNATEDNVEKTAGFIKDNVSAYDFVEILAFHNLGEAKYEQLGLDYELRGRNNARTEDLLRFKGQMERRGLPVKISQL